MQARRFGALSFRQHVRSFAPQHPERERRNGYREPRLVVGGDEPRGLPLGEFLRGYEVERAFEVRADQEFHGAAEGSEADPREGPTSVSGNRSDVQPGGAVWRDGSARRVFGGGYGRSDGSFRFVRGAFRVRKGSGIALPDRPSPCRIASKGEESRSKTTKSGY